MSLASSLNLKHATFLNACLGHSRADAAVNINIQADRKKVHGANTGLGSQRCSIRHQNWTTKWFLFSMQHESWRKSLAWICLSHWWRVARVSGVAWRLSTQNEGLHFQKMSAKKACSFHYAAQEACLVEVICLSYLLPVENSASRANLNFTFFQRSLRYG